MWWSAYTVEPDRVGKRTVELLTQAKRRGCDVILLYDSIGSRGVDNEFLAPLRKAGACTLLNSSLAVLFWCLLLMPPCAQHVSSSAPYAFPGGRVGGTDPSAITRSS